MFKNQRFIFYSIWLVLAFIQAALTELQDDEAYYWVYSKFLDWGYYDHPPMIALLVKAGYALFPNELGVRLLPVLLNVGTLVLLEKIINRKNPVLFFAIALSLALIQLGGFMAVPDIPLVFFTVLFFFTYQRFLHNENLLNSLLLGLAIALLFYSKYQGLLIVLFTLMSNLRLFARYFIWIAGIVALILFIPHLWWQYQHDWVSFRYHLFESNVKQYKAAYTLEYLLGQIGIMGPIAGLMLIPASIMYKPKDLFEKSLRYTFTGILVFFLLSSFRGRVEANWTTPAIIPMIILSHRYLEENFKWKRLFFKALPVSIVLILFARIIMLEDILPLKAVRERYHSWKAWPSEVKKITRGLPVVFGNYYQYASKYWFYSGQISYAQSNYKVRKNNYYFWPIEDSLLGKPVYVLNKHNLHLFEKFINTSLGIVGYKYDPDFVSLSKICFEPGKKSFSIAAGDSLVVDFKYNLPAHYKNYITSHPVPPDTTVVAVFDKKGWVMDIPTRLKLVTLVENKTDSIIIKPFLPKGKYVLRFALHVGNYYPAHNSENIKLEIK